MPNVRLFAFTPSEFSSKISQPIDNVLARLDANLEEEDHLDGRERGIIAVSFRKLLEQKCQAVTSDDEMPALGLLLKWETEEIDLDELAEWKWRAFAALRLEELTSSPAPPFFRRLDDLNQYRLQYFTESDLTTRILPEVTRRAEEPGPPDLDDEDDEGEEINYWTNVYKELREKLQRIRDDGADAILITEPS